jgi:hypothetical protein
MGTSSPRSLRDLPLPVRLVLAVFLASVGLGYLSALVQLRLQHGSAGHPVPTGEDAVAAFHGRADMCQMERLLEADAGKPFNGTGSMRRVFSPGYSGWKLEVLAIRQKQAKLDPGEAEAVVLRDREGERQALLAWIRSGCDRTAYEEDSFPIDAGLAEVLHLSEKEPWITADFLDRNERGEPCIHLQSIINTRCVTCHKGVSIQGRRSGNGGAARYPLTTYEEILPYCEKEKSGGMSVEKLAQSTHVHLLGFSLLWGVTGLLFACTSYPGWVRLLVGPWVLVAQVGDIACWWLGWKYPLAAQAVVVTGGLVGLGLMVQLLGTLLNLFGRSGRLVLLTVLLTGSLATVLLYLEVIGPRL